MGVLIHHYLRY